MGTNDRIAAEAVFSVVPEWVTYHPEITDKALRLYCVLARYTAKDKTAFPSRLTLGKRMGCTRDTVDRALTVLETIGAVLVERRSDPINPKKHLTSIYTLRVAAPLRPRSRVDAATSSRVDAAQNENHSEREPLTSWTKALRYDPPTGATPRDIPHTWTLPTGAIVDLIWDTLVKVCEIDTSQITDDARGSLNRSVKQLRKVGADPVEIPRRAKRYKSGSGPIPQGTKLTHRALVSHWPELGTPDVSPVQAGPPHEHRWAAHFKDEKRLICVCGEKKEAG